MKYLLIISALCLFMSNVQAAPSAPTSELEVMRLLNTLGDSECEFYRNGIWYSGADARDHLQRKYQYLLGKGKAATTEQFISHAATKSSMSGKSYQVRCAGNDAISSAEWLHAQLDKLRTPCSSENITPPAQENPN